MAIKTVRRPKEIDDSPPSECYFCNAGTIYWNLEALEPVCHRCAARYGQRHLSRRCPECETGGFVLIQCIGCGYIFHQEPVSNG